MFFSRLFWRKKERATDFSVALSQKNIIQVGAHRRTGTSQERLLPASGRLCNGTRRSLRSVQGSCSFQDVPDDLSHRQLGLSLGVDLTAIFDVVIRQPGSTFATANAAA